MLNCIKQIFFFLLFYHTIYNHHRISNSSPGIFCSSASCITSYIVLVLSPIKRPAMNPDWSSFISLSSTVLILLAIAADAILYTVIKRHIGQELSGLIIFGYQGNSSLLLS